MYTFSEEIPSPDVYNGLREIVGWGAMDNTAVEAALPNSVFGVIARYDDQVVGFARVVGDGGLAYQIQEIIVHPDHQRRGIASTFMDHVMRYLEKNAVKRAYIGVFVAKGLESFYARYGFWRRPTARMGPGMIQLWNDAEVNEELGRPE